MRNIPVRLSALGLIVPALALLAHAQGPPVTVTVPVTGLPLAAPAGDNFSSEPFVVLRQSTVFSFKADGTGYREQTLAVKVQNDAALRQLGVVAIGFASASEHVEFRYVRVRRPDGTVLDTNIADAIEEPAPVTREAPFYSDLKQKELPVKSLHVGDTLEWQVRIVRTAAEAPGQFWGSDTFASKGVVLDEDFELRVPASLTVNVWTNPKGVLAPVESLEAGERVYRWKHSNLKTTVGPAADAARKAEETHVLTADEEVDATDGKLPSIAWTTFPDWAALGAWYRKLEAGRIVPDATVKAKVDELTAGKTTEEDKAHAVYNYVSTQIRYIGVAFGIGRYQPHSAAEVLANQYGDCKDKHTLLAAMLTAIGVSSDAVLIGEEIRFNPAVPSPEAFNHLITRAHVNGQTVWLDATTEVAPWRVLLYNLRDKPALVVPDSAAALIAQTPADLPFAPTETWSAVGSLDANGVSDSHISLTLHDDNEVLLRAVLHQVSPAQYAEFTTNFVGGLGYQGTGASNSAFTRPDDLSTPFNFSFDYHREKAGDWSNLRTVAQLQPVALPVFDPGKPPTSTILLGVPRTLVATAEMKLPTGWSAELPEAVHAKSAFATYDMTFHVANGKLYSERRVVVIKSKVPAADWKEYKKFQEAAGLGTDPFIQLTRNSAPAGSTPSAPSVSSAAAMLINQANDAIRNLDYVKAKDLLDKAKKLSPEQRNLWGTYGYRAYQLGMPSEAIEAYRKELQFHPDQTWVYAPLATELSRTGKKEEALAALRTGVDADPSNLRVNLALVTMLASNGDNDGAISAGRAALKLLPSTDPKNIDLVIATANALMSTHAPEDSADLLLPALKNAETPHEKNNLAYRLALTGLHLNEAEAAERSALDTLSAESASWTLDEAPGTLKQASSLLVSSWDTLGYILFRQGHLPEARNYIEASWRIHPRSEAGLHLGDLLLALKDPQAALDVYELAQGALPSPAPGTKGAPAVTLTPQMKLIADQIEAGIARAESAGAKPRVMDGHAELQKMRTYPTDGNGTQHRLVEYSLLIGQDKVERTRASGKTQPADADPYFHSFKLPGTIPAGSNAKIVLNGFLNCTASSCEFVAEP